MKIIHSLWGGSLTRFSFDLVMQMCELEIRVLDGSAVENHTVRCSHVSDFHFFNGIPGTWSYAEVTEVEVSYDQASLRWQIEFMLWSEEAGIAIRADNIHVDGVPLKPGAE